MSSNTSLLQVLTRFILALSIIVYVQLYNFDFKIPLTLLSIAYFVGMLVLYPLHSHKFLKHLLFLFDVLLINYFMYTTGNIYFSLFFITFIFFAENLIDLVFMTLYTISIFGVAIYLSGFSDFTYIFITLGFWLILLKYFLDKNLLEKQKEEINNLAKNLYIENLKCNDKSEFYRKFYDLSTAVRMFKSGKLDPEIFIKELYENLNCNGIVLFNINTKEKQKKGLLNFDEAVLDDFNLAPKTYVNDYLNLRTGYEFIIVRQINDYFILVFYKSAILDDSEILDIIK
ncbi:hypothetical protein [Sulfurihydrogenibium sp.]|uniref:hypothetical protein n=1 Tax=Sulfurihydrogenibium sp. TaxID=2053621 RepID=UPI002616CCE5|nr:hypothetical protein [Sulfurihydrogenibium sp.]